MDGNGLGLYISKKIIQELNGSINNRITNHNETEFYFTVEAPRSEGINSGPIPELETSFISFADAEVHWSQPDALSWALFNLNAHKVLS